MTRQDLFRKCNRCNKIFNTNKEGSTDHPELCDDCYIKHGDPCRRMTDWVKDDKVSEARTAEMVDRVFEYLKDNLMLNKKGEKFAHEYWEWYIHRDTDYVLNRRKRK